MHLFVYSEFVQIGTPHFSLERVILGICSSPQLWFPRSFGLITTTQPPNFLNFDWQVRNKAIKSYKNGCLKSYQNINRNSKANNAVGNYHLKSFFFLLVKYSAENAIHVLTRISHQRLPSLKKHWPQARRSWTFLITNLSFLTTVTFFRRFTVLSLPAISSSWIFHLLTQKRFRDMQLFLSLSMVRNWILLVY